MIQCLAAFLDFAFLARRSSHTAATLLAMDAALARFRKLRELFVDAGVRPDGFSLPRQHALLHYTRLIRLFGSPNGVCSSITESKHIAAVKRPWRASNRNNPLIQILRTNTRLSKLAAFRVELGRRRLLHGDVVSHALRKVSLRSPSQAATTLLSCLIHFDFLRLVSHRPSIAKPQRSSCLLPSKMSLMPRGWKSNQGYS